jgi:hypothetical protein
VEAAVALAGGLADRATAAEFSGQAGAGGHPGPAAGAGERRGPAAGAGERSGRARWAALAGVGTCRIGLDEAGASLERLWAVVAELGGIAPVVRGPGGLGTAPQAPAVQERLKRAFDPDGVLAPGRFWGGL